MPVVVGNWKNGMNSGGKAREKEFCDLLGMRSQRKGRLQYVLCYRYVDWVWIWKSKRRDVDLQSVYLLL